MRKIKIGIIGCGTIGSFLARAVCHKFSDTAMMFALCDRHPERVQKLKRRLGGRVKILSIPALIQQVDVVIECASTDIAAEVAKKSLDKNKKVLILSVGGLLKISNLASFVGKNRGKLWIPSGALAGVDGLLAASETKLRSVKLITRKPPRGLQSAPYFQKKKFPLLKRNQEQRVFRGTALQAVKYFPQNVNVAAVLSLAGLGPRRTKVEIWTSKAYRANQHEVQVESQSGKIRTLVSNRPSPTNPKTSHLATLSALATLRRVLSSFEIGL